jgi:hypothetical protein
VRNRWFGAKGFRVPEIVVEGDPAVPVDQALVLDDVSDEQKLKDAHDAGTPVVVRADSPETVKQALERPEVASVLVPGDKKELLELDLTKMTYG